MRSLSKDQRLVRGIAAALFALVAVPAAHGQGGAVGAGAVRPRGDSIFVRVIDANAKVRIDSIMALMGQIMMEPPFSQQAHRLRRSLETAFQELRLSGMGPGGPYRLDFERPGVELRQIEATRIRGWIGINVGMAPRVMVSDSTGTFERFLRYPQIISVEPNSPALRAGIAPGDMLIAYDGQDVVRTNRLNMSELLVPERKLEVTVKRDGDNHDFTLIVAKPPERIVMRRAFEPGDMPVPPDRGEPPRGRAAVVMPGRPMGDGVVRVEIGSDGGARAGSFGSFGRAFYVERTGVFGASLLNISADLAKAWKLENGVLIDQCGEETPAFRAGLRPGDIVVSVGGQQVFSAGDVIALVQSRSGDHSLGFQIVRERKPMNVTVKW